MTLEQTFSFTFLPTFYFDKLQLYRKMDSEHPHILHRFASCLSMWTHALVHTRAQMINTRSGVLRLRAFSFFL